jgi:hypothetical protein
MQGAVSPLVCLRLKMQPPENQIRKLSRLKRSGGNPLGKGSSGRECLDVGCRFIFIHLGVLDAIQIGSTGVVQRVRQDEHWLRFPRLDLAATYLASASRWALKAPRTS